MRDLVIDASPFSPTTNFEDELDTATTYARQQGMRPMPASEAEGEHIYSVFPRHELTYPAPCSATSSGPAQYVLG
jgi:hypothetical protein